MEQKTQPTSSHSGSRGGAGGNEYGETTLEPDTLSMRTKLKVNHMLSTAVSIRRAALVNVLARMKESNLGCGTLDSTNYTLKISDKYTLSKLSR